MVATSVQYFLVMMADIFEVLDFCSGLMQLIACEDFINFICSVKVLSLVFLFILFCFKLINFCHSDTVFPLFISEMCTSSTHVQIISDFFGLDSTIIVI